jgi:hypothetical protein
MDAGGPIRGVATELGAASESINLALTRGVQRYVQSESQAAGYWGGLAATLGVDPGRVDQRGMHRQFHTVHHVPERA